MAVECCQMSLLDSQFNPYPVCILEQQTKQSPYLLITYATHFQSKRLVIKVLNGKGNGRQRWLCSSLPLLPDGGAEPTVSQTDRPGERSRGPAGADASMVLQSFLSLCQTYKSVIQPRGWGWWGGGTALSSPLE